MIKDVASAWGDTKGVLGLILLIIPMRRLTSGDFPHKRQIVSSVYGDLGALQRRGEAGVSAGH